LSQRIENGLEGFHEDLHEQPASKVASPRAFGLTFAAVFLAIGALLSFRHGQLRPESFVVGFIFLIIALVLPGLLAPLNLAWTFVGSVLHRVMTQILLGLVFVFAVAPVALLRRVFGGSGLALRFESKLDSYWIVRDHPVPDAESLKRQF
jgi:hypothetical protein